MNFKLITGIDLVFLDDLILSMNNLPNYQNLKIWQKGVVIADVTYLHTKKFPKQELFGLVSQMQRSAVSVPSNIAEGFRRHSKKDFRRFLYIALGSLSELETQFLIAHRQNYMSEESLKKFMQESQSLSRMIYSFIKTL